MGGKFYVACPEFGQNFDTDKEKANREYAHPVDLQIIKILDNGVVNSVFKQLVEMMADSVYGSVIASGVMIHKKAYPEINILVDECVEKLNIKRPYVIISSAISELNAMAFGSDEEPYIALSPLMVKTMNPQQLKFVIGHECGHVAMGHMVYHSVVSISTAFAQSVPLLGPVMNMVGGLPLKAWSRRSEISADRAGLICCGDCDTAQRALVQLALPFMDAGEVDIADYVENADRYLKKGVIRKLNEYDDAHPIIPKRIQALKEFASSEAFYKITGNAVPDNAISDAQLNNRIEQIIKVL